MLKRNRLLFVVIVMATLAGLFIYGLQRGDPDRNIRSNYLGKPVPPFELPVYERYQDAYGTTLKIEDYIGQPMVINFWSPTCPPCLKEAPELQKIWEKYSDELLILGIHTRDAGMEGGNKFLDQFGLTFPSVFDEKRRLMIDYGLFGLPETFFVNSDGTLAYKHVGQISEVVLENKIEALY